jgi:hypothetical protein
MGKLWIIGDSFFTQCVDTGERGAEHLPLGNASWTEQVAKHLGLDTEYYHAFGGASNYSILLGLDNVVDQPRFNIETDQVLCGFTTTVRHLYCGTNPMPFDRKAGLLNEKDFRLVGSQSIHQHDSKMINAHEQYQSYLYPVEFYEYIQCMLIDGAITRAKQRGINIIPHVGFMNFPYWYEPGSIEQAFDWHNKEMFSVPSFQSVYKHIIYSDPYDKTNETQFDRYSNHMSPQTAQQYAQLYIENHNDR